MRENCIMDFLKELERNNDLKWMADHKAFKEQAAAEFEELLQMVMERLAEKDPSVIGLPPKNLIYRLNRDTRFSRDKSPYHAAFRAHISPAGRAPIPGGYYLNLAPGNVFLGGGVHAAPFKDAVTMIRDYICGHGEELETIVSAPDFQNHFTMTGERLKNVPRGYDADFPQSEYLKYKSWDIECRLETEGFCDLEDFCERASELFLLMRPFNDYFNEAVRDFQYPVREN